MKLIYLCLATALLVFNFSFSQQDNKNFEVKISISRGQILLESDNGSCAFNQLSASRNHFSINQNGMLNVKEDHEDVAISNFIFDIKKNGNTIKLKGIKGTNWQNLDVSLSGNQTAIVNQNGLVVK